MYPLNTPLSHSHSALFVGTRVLGALVAAWLSGCATSLPSETTVQGPYLAKPLGRPTYVERVETGSLFNPQMTTLYSGRAKPRNIGDTLKVDISETIKASSTVANQGSRESEFSSTGPGSSEGAFFADLLNQDMSASGSTRFKGNGSQSSNNSFAAQIAATVVNVLPNGHLVVAGERSVGLNRESNTLRFSGIVDPMDVNERNVVQSKNVVNARLEVVANGDMADTTRRTWLQKVLTNTLAVW